jgi:hypothetical protein
LPELELKGEPVGSLGDEHLKSLVIKLCEAELRRSVRPSSAVAGGNQTASDGGVDVRVQLKTSESASASNDATFFVAAAAGSSKLAAETSNGRRRLA